MWNKIQQLLGPHHPERLKVARLCIENGLAIRDDGIYLNQIEIPTARIARAAGVDRRTVVETVRMIQSDKGLRAIFGQLQSAGLSLRGVAKQLGLGVVEITAKDPKNVGILAGASKLLADAGISIRQALVDDPELSPEPKLTFIGDTSVPGNIIPEMLKIKGVARISVY
jgi:predicted regulator of amino acid metabolism with ACT domain